MKSKLIQILPCFLILCFQFLISCKTDDSPFITREEESVELNKKYDKIISMTEVECTDSSSWGFTAIGINSCGETKKYIPYPLGIDTTSFKSLISLYNAAEIRFIKKWNIADCDTLSSVKQPTGVVCTEGRAQLVYE
ncbi:hypothetical protein O2K51_01735 [Apibacter raozihei]|uniref:hypothetical protein n=1 Tax=Apibacter TaxID=1778601 RepID=UPI000FE44035|nr:MULTISPECIES: hypothetical protein [Apibacter]